jgi:hypothetical protein
MDSGGRPWIVEAVLGQWRPSLDSGGRPWIVEAVLG